MTAGRSLFAVVALVLSVTFPLCAQQRKLQVHASNLRDEPVAGVVFSLKGLSGGSAPTDRFGKTEILLGSQTRPGSWVDVVVGSKGYVLISPWNARALVPPFDAGAEFFVPVWLYKAGDSIRAKDKLLISWAAQATSRSMPSVIGGATTEAQRKANRAQVAKEFGLRPEELEQWLATFSSREPYESGLIALLNGRYTEAVTLLSEALEATAGKQNGDSQKVVNAALFLGHANYLLGNYQNAAQAYRRAAELVPEDTGLLNSLALALDRAKDISGAESLFRRIVEIKEGEIRKKISEPDSEELAASLTNLGRILTEKNKCAEAEPLLLRALPIWEGKLSPTDRNLATAYRNVATVVYCGGDYGRASQYFEKEAGVYERIYGAGHPEYAAVLNEYAMKMYRAREYAVAEPLLERCLAIWRKQVGQHGSDTIRTLRVLGNIRAAAKDYAAAEDFYTEALTAREAESGPDNAALVEILYDLDAVYQQQKNWAKAERALRQILRIRQKESPRGRNFATALSNLALLLYNREDYHNAEKYFQEALPLLEKHLGPDAADVRFVRRALDNIKKITGDRTS